MNLVFLNKLRSPWIDKYNKLVTDVCEGKITFDDGKTIEEGKTTLHHIIPRSIAPELENEKSNHVWLPFKEHIDAHYYLWKANPQYAPQLWFGAVYGRKHNLWDFPCDDKDAEYEQLKRDVAKYRKKRIK